ncbi:MAG: polysaccharide deacetylase family protein [Nitrospira sp.]|nr:polysaccharide deacetylase family protein [Nitrospira sp.]
MKLVVTVDVEEDQWGITPPCRATVNNVYRLPLLQTLFDEFGVVPTYLLTYPVVGDERAAAMLRDLLDAGACEIGAHCHPWNTPPHGERRNVYNSMLCNLPVGLQYEKLQCLHDAIHETFDLAPIAFRSGRWGFDSEVAMNLLRLGYRIDSSVTPYTSWTRDSGPDFSHISPRPYAVAQEPFSDRRSHGALAEVPVSIGYLHGEFQACATLARRLRRSPYRRLRLGGLLSRLHLLRKVWLSPEIETPAMMLQLVRQMRRQGYRVLNLVFHSSALMSGCGPFVRTSAGEQRFLKTLKTFLELVSMEGVTCTPLSKMVAPATGGASPKPFDLSRAHSRDGSEVLLGTMPIY